MYRPLFEMIEDASKQELKKLIKNTKNRMAKLKREMNKKTMTKSLKNVRTTKRFTIAKSIF